MSKCVPVSKILYRCVWIYANILTDLYLGIVAHFGDETVVPLMTWHDITDIRRTVGRINCIRGKFDVDSYCCSGCYIIRLGVLYTDAGSVLSNILYDEWEISYEGMEECLHRDCQRTTTKML